MTRRALLGMPLAALAADRSRVTRLETFVVKVNHRGNWILVRLTTDTGLTGIGEASQSGASDEAQLRLVGEYFARLRGRSIWDLELFRQELFGEIARRGRPAAVAFSALEQCLWDLRGKAVGLPVCDLLGGRLRPAVRNYANINRSTVERTPAGFARMAEKAVAAGFDAVKLAPFDGMPREASAMARHTTEGIECARAVRAAIGPRRDLLVDAHSHFDVPRGLELARKLESLKLYWLEEVTPAEPVDHLAAIHRAAKMSTAGGENLFGVAGFYPYIRGGAVDVIMPDVKYCGGVWELKRIAALAEAAGLKVSPHGPASPVGHMAAAHLCVTIPNCDILEFSFGEVPWRAELVDPPEAVPSGRTEVATRPGFGISLNDRAVARYG
jgi:galactonate dehydratase